MKRGTEYIDRVPMNWDPALTQLGAICVEGWAALRAMSHVPYPGSGHEGHEYCDLKQLRRGRHGASVGIALPQDDREPDGEDHHRERPVVRKSDRAAPGPGAVGCQ